MGVEFIVEDGVDDEHYQNRNQGPDSDQENRQN